MSSIGDFARVGNPDAPIGSPEWCLAAHLNLRIHKHNHDAEVSSLKYGLREFKNDKRWGQLTNAQGRKFGHWKEYVQCPEPYGLGMPIEEAEAVLEAKDETRLRDVLAARDRAAQAIAAPPRLAKQGELGRGRTKVIGLIEKNISSKYGTGADYGVDWLRRDHPEILERLAAGDFRSVAEAVRFAKSGQTRGLTKLFRAWQGATLEERAAFLKEIAS